MAKYSLSWDGYKNNICGGFSGLQQNGEFVDMTLAADGHFVKVHQVLMALVSPYMKDLITSAPCQHPVIYLNNVSSETLTALLEYIYTGEVLLPSENLKPFINTAKNLHIKGLEEFEKEDEDIKVFDNPQNEDDIQLCHLTGTRRRPRETNNTEIENLPSTAQNISIKTEKRNRHSTPQSTSQKRKRISEEDTSYLDDSAARDDDDDDFNTDFNDSDMTAAQVPPKSASLNLQYSVSIRGSIQVILNRYIYNLHSTQNRSGLRRWRCIEYRNQRCLAFVVTKGNVVVNRANLHNHPFHDKKILQKIEKNAVFSALEDVETYKEKEKEKESTMEVTVDEQNYDNLEFVQMADTERKINM